MSILDIVLKKCDTKMFMTLFDMYEEEANRMTEEDLIYPNYDYVLKCSHVFNILDARGLYRYLKEIIISGELEILQEKLQIYMLKKGGFRLSLD